MEKEVYEILKTLEIFLSSNESSEKLMAEFDQLETNFEKFELVFELLNRHELLSLQKNPNEAIAYKDDEIASRARLLGNKYYREKEYVKALECYNQCLQYAPKGSETLAYAYANRSIIYMKTNFHQHCIDNIEFALNNNYPKKYKSKLIARENECLKKNGIDMMHKFIFEKSEIELSYAANKKLPFMIDGLECDISPEFGRHIRAKQDLYPGDIIMIEKPFTKILLKESSYTFCANCLKTNFLNLQPCKYCTQAMYCSETCESDAWKRFHKFECPIMTEISKLFTNNTALAIRAALQVFTLFDDLNELQGIINSIDLKNENLLDMESNQLTETIHFRGAYAMNIPNDDTFQSAGICAVAYHLLRSLTTLPNLLMEKHEENIFINILFHFIALSNSNAVATRYQRFFNQSPDSSNKEMKTATFGCGLYPVTKLFNHSCVPNVMIENIDGVNVMVVRKTIQEGEQLFVSYG